MNRPLSLLLGLAALGCAGAPSAARNEPLPTPPTPREAPAPAPTAVPAAPPVASPPPSVKLLEFRRVLEASVHSLALGKGARVAALGKDAWLDDGKGLKRLPPPPSPTSDTQIYFGRDDQPRLMGFHPTPHERVGVYARWRKGAWERGASEIGKLGTPPMVALFGVLGYDDPEVVCAVDTLCIIKRKTGWTMLPPPPGIARVELSSGTAWATAGAGVWRLEAKAWRALEAKPTFANATHVWSSSERDLWLAERDADELHHWDGTGWTAFDSPVEKPRALWAASASDVWLAAEGGVAHWDGKLWSRVETPASDLRSVTGRSASEVWLAGASGVWRGTSPQ